MTESNKMKEMPVKKLMVQMGIPMILSMALQAVYNIVDSAFVGNMKVGSEAALNALTLVFPVQMLMVAVGIGTGVGTNALLARTLGQGNTKKAAKVAGNSLFLGGIIYAVCLLFGIVGVKAYISSQTVDPEVISMGTSYLRICCVISFGIIFFSLFEKLLQATGRSLYSTIGQVVGAVINIILDPIFIFVFHLGVRGAALATVLSQAVGAIWILRFLSGKKTILHLRKENFRLQKDVILPCLGLGISTFVMLSTESILSISFTSSLSRYGGDLAVGAMTIITSVSQLATLPLQGICQGGQPIMSYNFGAGNRDRVKKAFFTQFTACTVFTGCFWLIMLLFPKGFAGIFSNNTELITYTAWALRIYMAGIFSLGFQVACQQSFMALGQAKVSLLLACLRKLILLIPLIFILPHFIQNKVFAVFLAEPISDILAAAITTATFFHRFHKILVCHTALVHEPETP